MRYSLLRRLETQGLLSFQSGARRRSGTSASPGFQRTGSGCRKQLMQEWKNINFFLNNTF